MAPHSLPLFHNSAETAGWWPYNHQHWGWSHWGRSGHDFGIYGEVTPNDVPLPLEVSGGPRFPPDVQIVGISVFSAAISLAFFLLVIKGCCLFCGCGRKSKSSIYAEEASETDAESSHDDERNGHHEQWSQDSTTDSSIIIQHIHSATSIDPVTSGPLPFSPNRQVVDCEEISESPGPPPFEPPPTYKEAVLLSQFGTRHVLETCGKCP